MESEYVELVTHDDGVEEVMRGNSVAHYFQNVRQMEVTEAYLRRLSADAWQTHSETLLEEFDILYDRIMTRDVSYGIKQEVEHWYSFNRDMIGYVATAELNQELEGILRRFQLL